MKKILIYFMTIVIVVALIGIYRASSVYVDGQYYPTVQTERVEVDRDLRCIRYGK